MTFTKWKCNSCGATITYDSTTKVTTRNTMSRCRNCMWYVLYIGGGPKNPELVL